MLVWPLLLTSLVFLTSEGRAANAPKDPVGEVKKIITKVNFELEKQQLQVVGVADYSVPLVLGSLDVTNGGVGILSTLVVRRDVDQHLETMQTEDGSIQASYDVSLGFEELHFAYSYIYRWILLLSGSGSVTIAPRINTVRLSGTVTRKADNTCVAELATAYFTELADYEVSLEPDGFVNTFLGYATALVYNHIIPTIIYSASNNYLIDGIKNPAFQTKYSEIICKSFV